MIKRLFFSVLFPFSLLFSLADSMFGASKEENGDKE